MIVLDNHSAHHARSVTGYEANKGFTLLFMPPYSSPLNPIERVWAIFKQKWSKYLAQIKVRYNLLSTRRDLELVMAEVGQGRTPNILRAGDSALQQVQAGHIV